jgi:hypothetical protein
MQKRALYEEEGKQIWLKHLRFHKSSILHVGFKTWVKILHLILWSLNLT